MGHPPPQLYQLVADLPADTVLAANVPESLWRDTRRASIVAPARHDKLSGRDIPDLSGRLREMGRLVGERGGMLVLEDRVRHAGRQPTRLNLRGQVMPWCACLPPGAGLDLHRRARRVNSRVLGRTRALHWRSFVAMTAGCRHAVPMVQGKTASADRRTPASSAPARGIRPGGAPGRGGTRCASARDADRAVRCVDDLQARWAGRPTA
jgi:hypothetical protein